MYDHVKLDFEESINYLITMRNKLDVHKIYDTLKDIFPLTLTTTSALPNGIEDYGDDYSLLCGESDIGKFQLYDNGLNIIFDFDRADGTYTHWHPDNYEEAVNDVINFMHGKGRE